MTPSRIGLIGASWRGEYFLRIAQQLPELFEIGSVLVRSESGAAAARTRWGVHACTSLTEFQRNGPYDYVIVSVPREVAPEYISAMALAGTPVLTETPPANELAQLGNLWRTVGGAPIQVAEQYRYQPQHAARLAIASSGILGRVHTAQYSVAHDYHGVSLIRAALEVGFTEVAIDARRIADRVISARGRDAWNTELIEQTSDRVVAWLDFGDRLGLYDFSGDQYVSPIRSRHVSLFGPQGELVDDSVRYVREPSRAVAAPITRETTGMDGDLEGAFLRRIWSGSEVLWENPYPGARLNDDELAVAEVMTRMARFARTEEPFYSLADGCHDHYLGMLIAESAATGLAVRSEHQMWNSETSALG